MKEIFITLIYIIIYQIFSWIGFILLDEVVFTYGYNYTKNFTCWIVLLIVGIISYFIVKNKIIKNKKYNKKIFFISLAIFWLLSMCIFFAIDMHEVVENFPFHNCTVIMCGMDYDFFWLSQWMQLIIVIVYEIICKIISKKCIEKNSKLSGKTNF